MEQIAICDQMRAAITVFDKDYPDWNDHKAIVWNWQPTETLGFASHQQFVNVSDVKLRRSEFYGGLVMLVTSSLGFTAIVEYPSGKAIWYIDTDTQPNPHAVELLPNGNLCVIASNGAELRMYAASKENNCTEHCSFAIEEGHGALWDPERELLWILGKDYISAMCIDGTADKPAFHELSEYHTPINHIYGHDLQPVYGNKNLLWVTNNSGAFQFDKTKLCFIEDYEGAEIVIPKEKPYVKAIGNFEGSGDIIRQIPNGTQQPWNTNICDIFRKTEKGYIHETRKFDAGAFYKVRVWDERYN